MTPPHRLSSRCGDIDPLGITGTPVIDTATDEIFLAEETEVGGNKWQDIRHWLVAVSLRTHEELWHRDIDPPDGNDPSVYSIPAEQQRPALTLLNGRIYVAFGGLAGDCGQYHGYVVDLPVSGDGVLASYEVPTQRRRHLGHGRGIRVPGRGAVRRHGQWQLAEIAGLRRRQFSGRAVAVVAASGFLGAEQLGAAQ